MLRLKKVLPVFLVAAMVFSLSACNSKLGLVITAKTGDSYKYHTLTSITSSSEMQNQKTTNKQDTTTDFIVTVDNVDSEGNFTMNYKYDSIKFESDSNGSKQTFDSSSSDSTDSSTSMYKSVIGKGFTTKMTKFGEVTEVSGVDELLDSMIQTMDFGEDENKETNIEDAKENLKTSFGDEALKSIIQQSTKVFPSDNIKVGDSWDIDTSVSSIVEIDTKTTYTLDKVEKKIAYISVKSEYSTDASKPSDYMGMEMTTDISGSMTGTITVDTRNCILSNGDMTQNMSGKMSVKIPSAEGSEAQTLDIPMDSTVKITYSTTKM